MWMSVIPASFSRAPASNPPKPPPITTMSTSSKRGSRSTGATYGSSTKWAKSPVTSTYWSLPSSRSRLSRSARYFSRRASGSNARCAGSSTVVIGGTPQGSRRRAFPAAHLGTRRSSASCPAGQGGVMGTLKTEIDPADVGFDAARLGRLDRHFQRYVDDGLLPGWLLAVSRHGQLAHVSTYGQRDVEAGLPVETDTIWRIYSMTKPITAVAALVAYEQGLFELNDPVRWYIPSFADTKVWRSGSFTAPVLEPITEELRIWQLFAHTSGLTYGFMQNHPVDALYRQAGFEWGVPDDAKDLAGICDHLAALPLVFQPGTEWQYSMGLDVLGRVIEVVAGMPFDAFLQAHVLDPLGMSDTVWHVDEGRADRLAALYAPTPGTKRAFRYDVMGSRATTPPVAPLGGGGLCGTASDYIRFAEMLRNRGELDGVHILAPKTV